MLILKDEMQDSFKIDGRMGDEKQKITGYVRYAENCTSGAVRRNILIVMKWQDCGTGLKLWPDTGLNNSSLDHQNSGSMKQEYSKIQEGSGQVGPCWLLAQIKKDVTKKIIRKIISKITRTFLFTLFKNQCCNFNKEHSHRI